MTFTVHGQAVSRGVAIGRAVIVTSSRVDVAHYFIQPEQTAREIERLCQARQVVVQDIERTQVQVQAMSAGSAPPELMALLDVHLMLLQDEQLDQNVRQWIEERHYNAEWALTAQLEVVARQFEEMDDPYLRERKADVEQVVERMLRVLQGDDSPVIPPVLDSEGKAVAHREDPLVLVAHDLSPADMLQFKQSVFAGFVTDVGGKTSHTAIVARSMDIPAVVGARTASQWIHQDDWVIIDGDAGVVVVNPSPAILDEYAIKQRAGERERERLARLKNTPAITSDGQRIELLANIEQPSDAVAALKAGAVGVGLFRTEFLFMGRNGQLPNEEEQYRAYVATVEGMQGLPVTIRTIDVGADKPLDRVAARTGEEHLNPALGLRAIRWCLSEPAMFLIQLRALLRAAAHGQVHVLVPMLAHASEIHQTLALLQRARDELDAQGVVYGPIKLGAMIEVPAAALTVPLFLKHFDFLSIGTNDLIQYTLAIDRADESVAHLYDPLHPAVLRLLADVIAQGHAQGKVVSVCGEMAGDVAMTRLLLGLGLRSFSMHPSQILAVKQQILRSDAQRLSVWAQSVLEADDPASLVND
ncbi:MAG: phosphoenolpyruvate--protein phosphotransferase [Hydrogenophaga sp.]